MNPHLSHEKYASRSSSLNYILIGAILLRSCTWDGVKSSKQLFPIIVMGNQAELEGPSL